MHVPLFTVDDCRELVVLRSWHAGYVAALSNAAPPHAQPSPDGSATAWTQEAVLAALQQMGVSMGSTGSGNQGQQDCPTCNDGQGTLGMAVQLNAGSGVASAGASGDQAGTDAGNEKQGHVSARVRVSARKAKLETVYSVPQPRKKL